jgi:dTDP-4-dehydrorhamnose reductase
MNVNEGQCVLIIGGDSSIGAAIANQFKKKKIQIITTTRDKKSISSNNIYLDLNDSIEHWAIPKKGIKTAIICAALTSIKYCEESPCESYRLNYCAAVTLVKELVAEGIYVIFLSTNLVFDGQIPLQKDSEHLIPRTKYGLHKMMAENVLLHIAPKRVAVLRLTKVLGNTFGIFEKWNKELLLKKNIYPIRDMVFAPISINLVVEAVEKLSAIQPTGIFQLSAISDITYAEAAYIIAHYYGFNKEQIYPRSAEECGVKIHSKYTSMDYKRAAEELDLKIISAQFAIENYLLSQRKNIV